MNYTDISSLAGALSRNVGKVIVGKAREVELILAALFANGHVLLEDVPGTGKTTLAKSLARSLDCDFARVQFTPDLLPADITGMRVLNPRTGEFSFLKGPVFTNVLLADEINRATPRTQSALLECMEERQVTEGGETYALEAPFLVIATQNPVETQGTFPLPEAQLDRFLIRVSLGYPRERGEAVSLMKRFLGGNPLVSLEPVASRGDLAEAAALSARCHVSEAVMTYVASLTEAARDPEKVRLGPSPRAMLALARTAQSLAAIRGRDYVVPDDVKELAEPVLAHRLVMRGLGSRAAAGEFLRELLERVPVPTEERP